MAPILDHWLDQQHRIRDSIIWENPIAFPGFPPFSFPFPQPYKTWSQLDKDALQAAFAAAWNFSSIQLTDLPPNILHPGNNSAPTTALSHSDAHSLYLASVGQSLAVEIGSRVGWSITNYSADNLAILFDSREFFAWSAADNGYEIQDLKGGLVVPASPHTMYTFLRDNDLIGDHRNGTIVRMVKWCHHNLLHVIGPRTTKTYDDVWQYRGVAPVLRTIKGTTDQANKEFGISHWTAGCTGTTGFLRAVLRTVNIPVVHDDQCGHALPYFSTDGLHLSHGDDPYDSYTFADPPFPMAELLIDQTQYDSWFGSGVSEDTRCNNIGRRVKELAIVYLPLAMLHDCCDDQAAGKSHAHGVVAGNLHPFTVAELEAFNFWTRMDLKIASYGGCAQVPWPSSPAFALKVGL
jgi:hypothetical protein